MVLSEIGTAVIQTMAKPFKWWVVVAEWEQAVRVRLGRNSTRLMPGIHLRIPWVDRVYVVNTRLRTATASGVTGLTHDGKTVFFSIALEYRVSDALALYDGMQTPEGTMMAWASDSALRYLAITPATNINTETMNSAMGANMHDSHGITGARVFVTSLTTGRAIRLVNNEDATTGGMRRLGHYDDEGERK